MEKTIQILPAPAGIVAYLANEDNTATPFPVVCLALVEDADGTHIDYAVAWGNEIELAQNIGELVSIEHGEEITG